LFLTPSRAKEKLQTSRYEISHGLSRVLMETNWQQFTQPKCEPFPVLKFVVLGRTRDMRIQNFLLRNPQLDSKELSTIIVTQVDASHLFFKMKGMLSAGKNLSCLACQNKFHFQQELKPWNFFPFQALSYAF